MNTKDQTTLYYRAGSSDKVYQVSIEPQDGGFVVNVAYGRRGSTLNTGSKTAAPVTYEAAKKISTQLIAQKLRKGYTPGPDGTPYHHNGNDRHSGIYCQLPAPVTGEEQVEALLADPSFCAQQKFDGRRLLIRKNGTVVEGINRRGLMAGIPEPVRQVVLKNIRGDCVLDGECVGDEYIVFDLLASDGGNLRAHPYGYRLAILEALIPASAPGPFVRRVETIVEPRKKEAFCRELRRDNAEGVVFKRITASYTEGRSDNGDQVKFKFYETASFVVGETNGAKRSVGLFLYRASRSVPAGNVTIPSNHLVPRIGSVVEVRYLYAFRQSGSVYQPVYLGVRDDVTAAECTVDQIKYKNEAEVPV